VLFKHRYRAIAGLQQAEETYVKAVETQSWTDPNMGREEAVKHTSFPERTPEYASTRILLVGTGRLAVRAAKELMRSGNGSIIIGALDSNPQIDLGNEFPGIPFLGHVERFQRIVLEQCIDEVHVALPLTKSGEFAQLLNQSSELGIPARFHLHLSSTKVVTAEFGRHPANCGIRRRAKRTLDFVLALVAVILLSPFFILIGLAILLTSSGPVVFRQQRVGLGRRQFGMLKFRTMVKNAEELHPQVQSLNNARGISFKIFRDPRVTRVGAILRRSSLDELPQFFNVLRGEMSLVGPRPIPVWVAEQLDQMAYIRRFTVIPGLTGLWQVEGREQDFDRMARQDLRYIDGWSLGSDIKILARTLPAVLKGEGAH
jgi:exopolysaccharide biosynthesis polyprenyl glycosylphosphotransferase